MKEHIDEIESIGLFYERVFKGALETIIDNHFKD